MTAFVAGVCGVLGLAVGSFLNVVVHRVPRRESVIRPRSRCPACGTELTARDNVPVLSWLVLRRRCRTCGEPISARYPAIELGTAALFVALAVRFGADAALPGFLLLAAALIAVSAIDLEHFIVPTRIVYTTLTGSAAIALAAAAEGHKWRSLWHAAAGSALAWAILFVIHLASPKGMGFGDVRLAALIGFWLGWIDLGHVLLGLFLAFVLASVVGVGLIAARRRSRKDRIPFGQFLAAGAMTAVLFGSRLLDAYLGR